MVFRRKGRFFVYMVRCPNGNLYTGYTNDLVRRIREHNSLRHGAKFLRGRKSLKLVFAKEYKYYKCAIKQERHIKKLPKRKKEDLIR